MKDQKIRYGMAFRKWIARGSLAAGFLWAVFFSYYGIRDFIPDVIRIPKGQEETFDFHLPIVGEVESEGLEVFGNQSPAVEEGRVNIDLNDGFSLRSKERGSYSISCKLFGLIQLKDVAVEVVEPKRIAPCGEPVGIYVKTDGVMVIGTGTVNGIDGMNYAPAENLVKSGDYVKTVDGEVVGDKESRMAKVGESGGAPLVLGIMRDGELIYQRIRPVQTSEREYKLGIWVRDDLAGIGTLTFCDEAGNYGALGHPVSDIDTGIKVELEEGTLYEAQVEGITKGERGDPGEISGMIAYQGQYRLGSVEENTNTGIYGKLEKLPEEAAKGGYCPAAMKQEVRTGEAQVISSVSGERKAYSIAVTRLDYNSENKGIVFRVTDPELLGLTGGIVQGMSGSPIVQDGKVIGAVTHVFVQDAAKGYGVFIENMLHPNSDS